MTAAGAQAVALDRDAKGLEQAKLAGAVLTIPIDLTEGERVLETIADIGAHFGTIDILVAAAGGVHGQVVQPLEDIDAPQWHQLFAAVVDGTFWCAQRVAPLHEGAGPPSDHRYRLGRRVAAHPDGDPGLAPPNMRWWVLPSN